MPSDSAWACVTRQAETAACMACMGRLFKVVAASAMKGQTLCRCLALSFLLFSFSLLGFSHWLRLDNACSPPRGHSGLNVLAETNHNVMKSVHTGGRQLVGQPLCCPSCPASVPKHRHSVMQPACSHPKP